VLEPLSGYLALAEKLFEDGSAFAEAFNFGPFEEDAKPVRWIVEQLTQSWGSGATWLLDGGTHPHEAHYLKLDCSKARAMLGWSPRWRLDQALKNITTWHKAHQSGQDMRALCLHQIKDYSTAT
jgi:CDP-glucose 4,6-dehydratase